MRDFTKLSKEEVDDYRKSFSRVNAAANRLSKDLEAFAAKLQRFAAIGINLKEDYITPPGSLGRYTIYTNHRGFTRIK